MLAQGADNVVGQGVTLVDPAADLADKALLTLGLGLGFDVVLVIGVGHGLGFGDYPGFRDGADEHTVGIQINVLFYLQAHEGVDIPGQERQPIVRTQRRQIRELVHGASALESEILEDLERRGDVQTVDVQNAGLLDDVVGVVCFVDAGFDSLP